MILRKYVKLKILIFKTKMFFIKPRWKPVLKMFSKQLEFYKSNFDIRFCYLACFLRKLLWVISKLGLVTWHILQGYCLKDFQKLVLTICTFYKKNHFEAARPVLDMLFNMYDLHGVLDANRCQMPNHRWKDRKPSLTWLSRD